MSVAENAVVVVDKGVGSIESLFVWFSRNVEGLLIGLAVAAGIVAIMLGIRWVGTRMVGADPHCLRWRGIIGRVLAKTSIWFMVFAALDIVVTWTPVPARIGRLIDILFIVAVSIQGAVWARELILGMIMRRVGDDHGATTLGNATAIVRVLVSVALFALAIIVILENLGANVTALITGLGIGGIAIGLAAQGIFADLFAALAILFDKPFRRGDVIRYGTTTGTVEKIGLKTVRLRSVSGEQVIMGNTKLLEQEVTNVVVASARRIWLTFGLTYQTPPEVIENLPKLVAEALKAVKSAELVRCVATAFGPSSIDCELVYDDHTIDPQELAQHKSAIIIGVMRLFRDAKIDFAYPTQTTFTAAPDGTMIMPYYEPPSDRPPVAK